MTPDELERLLDRQNHKKGSDGVLYAIALIVVMLIIFIIYGRSYQ